MGKGLLTLRGCITPLTGQQNFIHLVAKLKLHGLPVRGRIIRGSSPCKQHCLGKLRQYVCDESLESEMNLTGRRAELKHILAISNLVLSLSNQAESFGRTTLKALSLGPPRTSAMAMAA